MSKLGLDLSPQILRVDSFDGMLETLQKPQVKTAVSTTTPFEYQELIEAFNHDKQNVYVVIGSPLNFFCEKLSQHLKKKGLSDSTARTAFARHIYKMTKGFLDPKKHRKDRWQITITSTFLKNTKQPKWHIDSYDTPGNTY